jgi:hypothetical protein
VHLVVLCRPLPCCFSVAGGLLGIVSRTHNCKAIVLRTQTAKHAPTTARVFPAKHCLLIADLCMLSCWLLLCRLVSNLDYKVTDDDVKVGAGLTADSSSRDGVKAGAKAVVVVRSSVGLCQGPGRSACPLVTAHCMCATLQLARCSE